MKNRATNENVSNAISEKENLVLKHSNVQTLTGSSTPLDFIDRNRIFMFAANTTEQDDNCTLVRKSNQTYHLQTACTAKSLRPYDTSCFDTSTPLPPADLVPVHAAPATHRPGPSPRCHHWPGLRHRLMSLAFLPACGGGQLSRALKLRLVPSSGTMVFRGISARFSWSFGCFSGILHLRDLSMVFYHSRDHLKL